MSSKIKQYFANKENRIKCGITGGTIALAVIIFVGMVFMEENETQNNSIETVSQTESDTQTEEETGYSFNAGDLYDMRLDAQTIEDYYMKSCGDQFNLYTIDEDGVLWGSGHNEYAQIGLGYADEEFHEKKSKIAEHVVHVDYSQKVFCCLSDGGRETLWSWKRFYLYVIAAYRNASGRFGISDKTVCHQSGTFAGRCQLCAVRT